MKAHPAKPSHSKGDTVDYIDRHGRPQRGEIVHLEASWHGKGNCKPLIKYSIRHPTYKGFAHVAEDDLAVGLDDRHIGQGQTK